MGRATALAGLVLALLAGAASAEPLEAVLKRAAAAAQQGQPRAGIELLDARLAAALPGDDPVLLRGLLGDTLMMVNGVERALAHYTWIAEYRPDVALAHYKRGAALERLGRCEEAVAAYQRAEQRGHDASDVASRVGFCLKVLADRASTPGADRPGYRRRAAQSLRRAIDLDPSNRSALGNLADLAFNAGERRGALVLYEHMDRLAPDEPTTLARIGSTYESLGEHESALNHLRRALEILAATQPTGRADAWLRRDVEVFSRLRAGRSLIALGRGAEAREELARVVAIADDQDPNATSREVERSRVHAVAMIDAIDGHAVPASAP